MDDRKEPAHSSLLPLQVPHGKSLDLKPDCVLPLRLLLHPEGGSLELNRPDMIAGRHSEADIRLRSPEVSRRHCRFVFAEAQWQVFDLNSLNGVWINGLRVQHAILQNKDVLHIGPYDFQVEIGPTTLPMPGATPEQPHKKAS